MIENVQGRAPSGRESRQERGEVVVSTAKFLFLNTALGLGVKSPKDDDLNPRTLFLENLFFM